MADTSQQQKIALIQRQRFTEAVNLIADDIQQHNNLSRRIDAAVWKLHGDVKAVSIMALACERSDSRAIDVLSVAPLHEDLANDLVELDRAVAAYSDYLGNRAQMKRVRDVLAVLITAATKLRHRVAALRQGTGSLAEVQESIRLFEQEQSVFEAVKQAFPVAHHRPNDVGVAYLVSEYRKLRGKDPKPRWKERLTAIRASINSIPTDSQSEEQRRAIEISDRWIDVRGSLKEAAERDLANAVNRYTQ